VRPIFGIWKIPGLQWLVIAAAFAAFSACSSFNPLTVSQIVAMTREGVPPDTIIARIDASNTVYRLHAYQIDQLSKEGVNDKVLDYMQHTYLDAVQNDQSLADWDNYELGEDGFFYGGDPAGWTAGWK
jgi:hypothetical protein